MLGRPLRMTICDEVPLERGLLVSFFRLVLGSPKALYLREVKGVVGWLRPDKVLNSKLAGKAQDKYGWWGWEVSLQLRPMNKVPTSI